MSGGNRTIKNMSPQFLVADIDRSIEFYTTQLDFEVDFRYKNFYAGIIKNGFSIHLKSAAPHPRKGQTKGKMDIWILFFLLSTSKICIKKFPVNKSKLRSRYVSSLMAKSFTS